MKLKLNTIYVNNLKKSLKFYQNILQMKKIKEISPENDIKIVFLKGSSDCIIELISGSNKSSKKKSHSSIALGFAVNDMNKTVKKLKNNNVKITKGPIQAGKKTKITFIKDPNGIEIELIENLGF